MVASFFFVSNPGCDFVLQAQIVINYVIITLHYYCCIILLSLLSIVTLVTTVTLDTTVFIETFVTTVTFVTIVIPGSCCNSN